VLTVAGEGVAGGAAAVRAVLSGATVEADFLSQPTPAIIINTLKKAIEINFMAPV
jgi:hypothetical protein